MMAYLKMIKDNLKNQKLKQSLIDAGENFKMK